MKKSAEITLSIIVPVYKVEPYIEKCITSILENRLFGSHCELIVVDDGSPDRSMEVVERLCDSRPNVTLVRQVNLGLGMARNAGERMAKGEYLWFVDSDDWLPDGAIENIVALIAAVAPDVVNIDFLMSDGSRTTVENRAVPEVVYTGLDYLDLSYVQNPVSYYIYRSRFFRDTGLHFEKDIYHEDTLFTPLALFQAQRVVRLATCCYIYNIRAGSIMTSGNNLKHTFDMLSIVIKLDAFTRKVAVKNRQARILWRYTALAVGGVFHYWRLLSGQERRLVSAEMAARPMLGAVLRSGKLKYLIAVAVMLWPPMYALIERNRKA